MEFCIGKWAMLIIKSEKKSIRRKKQANEKSIRTLGEKENYMFWGTLEKTRSNKWS